MTIITEYQPKPNPDRRFDWSAYDDDTYDSAPDSPTRGQIGHGRTKVEAIADLLKRLAQEDSPESCEDVSMSQGTDLKTDIVLVRIELQTLRAELRNLDTRLTGEIGRIADRTLIRLCGVLVVLLGLLFAALHAWPPHSGTP